MGLPEAPRTVSVGLRSCYSWHFRGATTFYWASKLPSSLSQQPFNALKPSKPSSSFGLRSCYIWHFRGATTLPIGLRNCHLAFPSSLSTPYFPAPLQSLKTLPAALPWVSRPRELFLLAFARTVAAWPWCLPLCFSIAPSKLQNPPTPA